VRGIRWGKGIRWWEGYDERIKYKMEEGGRDFCQYE